MYQSILSHVALEQLENNIQLNEAVEAYNFIHKTLDVFSRLIYNFKTYLLHFEKNSFKRSELRFFHESKKLGYSNFLKKKCYIKDIMIPIPSGMKISYSQAVDILDDLFKKLDIQTILDTLLDYLNTTLSEDPSLIISKIKKLTKNELETNLNKIFSSKKTFDVPLHSVISSFTEIIELDQKILNYETVFKQVESVVEKLNQIENRIDKLIDQLETQKESIDRKFIKNFHDLIQISAFQLDAFGVIITEMSRIEHNFTLLLNILVKEAAKQ